MANWLRLSFVTLSSFSLVLGTAGLTQASTYHADVIYSKGGDRSPLPSTPAYTEPSVTEDLKVLGTIAKSREASVVIDSPGRIAALENYSNAVSNPQNPDFHHYLTAQALNTDFGPTPAMISAAENSIKAAGWTIDSLKGFVATATIPNARNSPGLPISPDIWSISGLAPHGIIRTSMRLSPIPVHHLAQSSMKPLSTSSPSISLAGEDFTSSPVVAQQTTSSNGDVVTIMSWNPRTTSTLPTGLVFNLFVTVEDSQGNFLPITQVSNLSDTDNALVSYGSTAMPGSSNTLWQLPLAAFTDISSGDTFSLQVGLQNGATLDGTFPLPAFTGNSTVLSALDAQQTNNFSGLTNIPASPGPIALFAIGSPPSLSDLSLFLDQNTNATPSTTVTFHYEDGATATEAGQSTDSEESQLDLEAASGSAPGAPIEDYVYPENDVNDPLISYLTDLSQQNTAKIASLSYGFYGESESTLSTLMDALTAEGITLLEASGDQGAWNGANDPGPIGLSSLEQIPSVLSVGGMDLAAPATTNSNGNTVNMTGNPIAKAWGGDYLNGIPTAVAQAYTSQNAASSGGYSTETPIPPYEEGFLPSNASGYGVPIIATEAGEPGLSGYLQGQNVGFGGTSLAAPLTAGWLDDVEDMLNLTSTGMGDINPILFSAAKSTPSIFTQAEWGSDGVYSVTNGTAGTWNPLTGLGLVNWEKFVAQYYSLVPSGPPTVTLNVSPLSPRVGQGVELSASSSNIASPDYQFWVENPISGSWQGLGRYSVSDTAAFTPSVPGTWHAEVFVKSATGTITTNTITLSVASPSPMVAGLSLTLSQTGNPLPTNSVVRVVANASESGGSSGVHYQFWVHGSNNQWKIVQNYSPANTLSLGPLAPGSYTIAAYALDAAEVKAGLWKDAFYKTTVINVDSSVSLSLPQGAATGNPVLISAEGQNFTHPVYQFWIETPTGVWQSSGAYSATDSWEYTPSLAGTYTVVVYVKDPYAPATAQYSLDSTGSMVVSP